jgi:hypothetical protein
MNETIQQTTRRTVLQRCLLFVAGAFGVPMVNAGTPGRPQLPSPNAKPEVQSANTVRFYARRVQVQSQRQKPGEFPAWTGRLHSRTDLLDQPNGAKIGEFAAACFGPESFFGSTGSNHAMELQTLKVSDGTLFGIGTAGPTSAGEREHAILGGTGRFAGARGSYVIRQNPTTAGKESLEFVITLLS